MIPSANARRDSRAILAAGGGGRGRVSSASSMFPLYARNDAVVKVQLIN